MRLFDAALPPGCSCGSADRSGGNCAVHDLRSLLCGGGSDDEIAERLITIWTRRTDRYSELRTAETRPFSKVEMSRIGG
jgi:molybdenum cofactor biosynthesis enzyme MoaA